MIDQNFMRGDGNGNYNLSDYIVRGDMMILLVRAFNLHSNAGGRNFDDVLSRDYYYDAVCTARNLGIAKGDGKNFMPGKYVTIEQVILFIERAARHAKIELSVDLESLYDDETLSSYATREDVCELIYYALTGNTDGFDGDFGSSRGWNVMTLSYSIENGDPLPFAGNDFSAALKNASSNETLSDVQFTYLPPASKGVLFYDYDEDDDSNTPVAKYTPYNMSELSKITFIPKSGYNGTVTVYFIASTGEGNSYNGKIVISVGNANIAAGTITYATDKNAAFNLDGSDFYNACKNAAAGTFSYIKFTSLPTSYGVLYYDYDEDETTHTVVTKNTSYDLSELSDITFAPGTNITGTATVSYVGYTAEGNKYTGSVKIIIKDSGTDAATIVYSTGKNQAIDLRGSDFGAVCNNASAGTFSHVKFTALPSYGVLYYDYDADENVNYTVSKDMSYDAAELSHITYVPKNDYSGTVTVCYTGYTTAGAAYTGTVQIIVG